MSKLAVVVVPRNKVAKKKEKQKNWVPYLNVFSDEKDAGGMPLRSFSVRFYFVTCFFFFCFVLFRVEYVFKATVLVRFFLRFRKC